MKNHHALHRAVLMLILTPQNYTTRIPEHGALPEVSTPTASGAQRPYCPTAKSSSLWELLLGRQFLLRRDIAGSAGA